MAYFNASIITLRPNLRSDLDQLKNVIVEPSEGDIDH
jgi:hypothetical protein